MCLRPCVGSRRAGVLCSRVRWRPSHQWSGAVLDCSRQQRQQCAPSATEWLITSWSLSVCAVSLCLCMTSLTSPPLHLSGLVVTAIKLVFWWFFPFELYFLFVWQIFVSTTARFTRVITTGSVIHTHSNGTKKVTPVSSQVLTRLVPFVNKVWRDIHLFFFNSCCLSSLSLKDLVSCYHNPEDWALECCNFSIPYATLRSHP